MTKRQLHQIEFLLQRLDAAVVVRDPGNARSAEAYEGLRKQIIRSSTNHRVHIAHLLSLSDSLGRGADIELIRDRVNDFLAELGVNYFTDYSYPELFEVVETVQGEHDGFEVLEAAVAEQLEAGNPIPIRLGKVREIQGPEPVITADSEISTPHHEPAEIPQREDHNLQTWVIAGIALVAGLLLGLVIFGGDDSKADPAVKTTIPTAQTVIDNPSSIPSTSVVPAITTIPSTSVVPATTTTTGA